MKPARRFNFLYSNLTKSIWYFLVLGWALARTFIVNDFFGGHGVNPWIYLVIDLTASVPYARYTHSFVISYLEKDWKKLRIAAVISVLTFYAPDIYILVTARQVPANIYFGFFLILFIFTAVSVAGIIKKIKPRSPK